MDNILVVGDSWAAGRESDTGLDRGWPEILEIPEAYRQGVSGSTANQWASNYNGFLDKAKSTEADTLIVSLIGNDMLVAMSDGTITEVELDEAIRNMRKVIETILREKTVVFLYADPSFGTNEQISAFVNVINKEIVLACDSLPVTYFDCGSYLLPEHFNTIDIYHTNRAGHYVLADNIRKLLE